jgi:hypothetical protein
MPRNEYEVAIRCEEFEIMGDCKLSQQGVNRSHLDSLNAAGDLKGCGSDVVAEIRNNQSQVCEVFCDSLTLFRAAEPL